MNTHEIVWRGTILLYLVAFALSILVARRDSNSRPWWYIGVGLFLLGINKQFELTSEFTRVLRKFAYQQSWYTERSELQIWVIFAIVILGVLLTAVFVFATVRFRWTAVQRMAIAGVALLGCYSMVRSVSLHQLDSLLYRDRLGIKLNWVIELGVLVFIIGSVWRGVCIARHNLTDESSGKPLESP